MAKMRILHYSTHNETCGIGKYQERFIDAMSTIDDVSNEIFPYSPTSVRAMPRKAFKSVLADLRSALTSCDALHIQYELSFFSGDQLDQIVRLAKSQRKKVIVTVHTAPDAQYQRPSLRPISLLSFFSYIRAIKSARAFRKAYVTPLLNADMLLAHNSSTRESLVRHGIERNSIQLIKHPVPARRELALSNKIRSALSHQTGDVIFATLGFVSQMKQVDHAIKALTFLPNHYKLAIIGGVHPSGPNSHLLDDLCDLISSRSLGDRVYITGYVEDDAEFDMLIRECDICVFPYDIGYYSNASSGALHTAFSNAKPAIVYPAPSFVEMDQASDLIAIAKSANYYELARALQTIDSNEYATRASEYAVKHSYAAEAVGMVSTYFSLLRGSSQSRGNNLASR